MLETYKDKRDFTQTSEPLSGLPKRGNLTFVVQKHAARRLHYDFRLEIDGVLKSWPVPKGPSLDPKEKRLAVMVEDHPLDYGTFEGVIAHGNYGAGQVIVWDAGVYSPDEDGRLSFGNRDEAQERMLMGLEAGKLSFTLRGRKLRGSWTLVRTTRSPTDWLLIKHKDEHADSDRDVLQEERSVQSGLTIEELKAGRLPDAARIGGSAAVEQALASGKRGPFPSRMRPMLARLIDAPFSHPEWLFEPKLDGFRALAFLRGGEVKLRSRNRIDLTTRFPEVISELQSQSEKEMVLDGEIVALNERGLPDFGLLQNRIDLPKGARVRPPEGTAKIMYYPFDLLYLDGVSLVKVPLINRKAALAQLLLPGDRVHSVEYVEDEGESFFEAARQLGLEGMIGKRRDSVYEPGVRSASWLKVKAELAQEFVIGGYTEGSGSRSTTFGALLLGYHEDNGLHYAGKVGSGFDQGTLEKLHKALSRLHTDRSPFADDAELAKIEAQWVRPETVGRVKFAQWTNEARLRAPVFEGLRPDIDPKSVRRETAASPGSLELAGQERRQDAIEEYVAQVLDQLSTDRDSMTLEIGEHRVSLTNLKKPLWPHQDGRAPVTKREMVRYYARLAPVVLPHLRDRPLTLTRYPDGIEGESFYQKHWEHRLPDFVNTVQLYSSHNEGDQEYMLVNNLPTLIWLAQIADIELHPWLSRTVQQPDGLHLTTSFTGSKAEIEGSTLNYPDFIVFDLDPYIYSGKESAGEEPELNRRAFAKVIEVARELKDILGQLSLSSFLKTSGKTGLHIYVPVLRQYSYKITRKTCETVGRFLVQNMPQDVTMEWTVSKRSGKIFLDHNQNVRGKNMASIYSLRPLPGAPVSTPLRWDELDDIYPTLFTIDTVPERVQELGDLWSDVLEAKHDLSRLLETE